MRDGRVVKGVRFRDHVDMGDIVELVEEVQKGVDIQAAQKLAEQGITLRVREEIAALTRTADGIEVNTTSGQTVPGFDAVVWAVGRVPNNALGLDAAQTTNLMMEAAHG